MRPSVTLARIATLATWPATRLDRKNRQIIPPVLCYHRVLPEIAGAEPAAYSVTPEQFADQMSLLKREGFESLTLEEYFVASKGLRKLSPRSVVVTFDDGFADNYLVAWPIMRRLNMKMNLFVCSGLVAGDGISAFADTENRALLSREHFPEYWKPLSWEQLREMAAAGVSVGFHSHAHRNLGKMSQREIEADAKHGQLEFKKHLDQTPQFFAFPYGHYGSYSTAAIELLTALGIRMFFSTELGRTPVNDSQLLVSRIVIHPEDDLNSFRRKLFGGYDWVGKVRRLGYVVRDSITGHPQRLSRA